MNSSENVRNAIEVMYKTYENVLKLMDLTKSVAGQKTEYILASPKFLRRRSDNDSSGWLISDFILLFQNKNDPDCESGNGWKAGAIYAMEIFIGDADEQIEKGPAVYLSKFEYPYINNFSEGISPASHWQFYYPLRNKEYMNFDNKDSYTIAIPKNKNAVKTYWGLKKVTTKKIDMFQLNSSNLQEMIFGNFDALATINA